jgi:hypothetical protein
MAELADAADSKSAEGNLVGVRPPLPAPMKSIIYKINASSDAFFCAQTVPKESALDLVHGGYRAPLRGQTYEAISSKVTTPVEGIEQVYG